MAHEGFLLVGGCRAGLFGLRGRCLRGLVSERLRFVRRRDDAADDPVFVFFSGKCGEDLPEVSVLFFAVCGYLAFECDVEAVLAEVGVFVVSGVFVYYVEDVAVEVFADAFGYFTADVYEFELFGV